MANANLDNSCALGSLTRAAFAALVLAAVLSANAVAAPKQVKPQTLCLCSCTYTDILGNTRTGLTDVLLDGHDADCGGVKSGPTDRCEGYGVNHSGTRGTCKFGDNIGATARVPLGHLPNSVAPPNTQQPSGNRLKHPPTTVR